MIKSREKNAMQESAECCRSFVLQYLMQYLMRCSAVMLAMPSEVALQAKENIALSDFIGSITDQQSD